MTARCFTPYRDNPVTAHPSMEGRSRDRPMELKVAVLSRCVIPSMEGRSRDRPMQATD